MERTILSWNVNGLRAVHKKGFLDWLHKEVPDVLLLQEIKGRKEDFPKALLEIEGYVTHFHPAKRKGYSGVAILSREEPDEWIEGLGDSNFDDEGRLLSARFGDVLISSAYFPNSQEAGKRLPYRLGYGDALLDFNRSQQGKGRKVLIGGDFNVSHQEIDLARPKQNTKNPGFLPQERAWFSSFLEAGYHDIFREENPGKEGCYSWWSYRAGARSRNVGWRLDYFCCDAALRPKVGEALILPEVLGSDHCPVAIKVDT
jgi:exodeoxyribonuclease-3